MRRLLAATGAAPVGLAVGGGVIPSTAQAHGGSPGYTPPPIAWGTCANATLKARGVECGFVIVPLDYARPDGTKIKIAVSRMKHKSAAADYQGVMLVNPGGPGESGLTYSVLQPAIPDNVGLDYDWIGFDPRGVGSSEPSLSCDGDVAGYNRPYYAPVTRQLESTWLARSKAYAATRSTITSMNPPPITIRRSTRRMTR
jgi:pimeloyl-ACP methyl ester carboxylesterase